MVVGVEHKFGTGDESYELDNTPLAIPTWLHESKSNGASCSIFLVIAY